MSTSCTDNLTSPFLFAVSQFVRIEPGSILQLLYPCSRHSPDRCIICGGNYRDHLTLGWSKHLYSPYDNVLENAFASGVTFPEKSSSQRKTGLCQTRPKYAFHRRYVMDDITGTDERKSSRNSNAPSTPMEKRTVQACNVSYSVPALRGSADDGSSSQRSFRPFLLLPNVRELVLEAVEGLIFLEEQDNANGEQASST